MTRLAMLTPLPPARTGVAHYASMLLPALAKRMDITAFDSPPLDVRSFDLAIYQLGNNPHHEWIYERAMEVPGIAVLHDLVLHHLIVEMTLARGRVEEYVEALAANHGPAGAAWARGRAAGLHSEMGNFLFPSSIQLAHCSRAVIVHNHYAAERLRSFGVKTPIRVVPHPAVVTSEGSGQREALRARLGYVPNDRVIGMFGFLTAAKRGETILEAFTAARGRDERLHLLIVGEPAPNIDMKVFDEEGIAFTGYAPDDAFADYFAAVDRLVNLRYPSAGETSGTIIRALAAGRPVAVSDYAQFAELPDECVTKIPLGEGERSSLAEFFLAELDLPAIAAAQRQWLLQHASIDEVADLYRSIAKATAEATTASANPPGELLRKLPEW